MDTGYQTAIAKVEAKQEPKESPKIDPKPAPVSRKVSEKRFRTAFTQYQLEVMSNEFEINPSALRYDRRMRLAKQLGLNGRVIKVWFQNQRQKLRKEEAAKQKNPVITPVKATFVRCPTPIDRDLLETFSPHVNSVHLTENATNIEAIPNAAHVQSQTSEFEKEMSEFLIFRPKQGAQPEESAQTEDTVAVIQEPDSFIQDVIVYSPEQSNTNILEHISPSADQQPILLENQEQYPYLEQHEGSAQQSYIQCPTQVSSIWKAACHQQTEAAQLQQHEMYSLWDNSSVLEQNSCPSHEQVLVQHAGHQQLSGPTLTRQNYPRPQEYPFKGMDYPFVQDIPLPVLSQSTYYQKDQMLHQGIFPLQQETSRQFFTNVLEQEQFKDWQEINNQARFHPIGQPNGSQQSYFLPAIQHEHGAFSLQPEAYPHQRTCTPQSVYRPPTPPESFYEPLADEASQFDIENFSHEWSEQGMFKSHRNSSVQQNRQLLQEYSQKHPEFYLPLELPCWHKPMAETDDTMTADPPELKPSLKLEEEIETYLANPSADEENVDIAKLLRYMEMDTSP